MMVLALLTVANLAVPAHDWYPQACCSGQDCQQVADDSVEPTAGGWHVKDTGEVIPYSRTQTSPDGHVHRCWAHVVRVPMSRTICLFVPPPAT
jgi:hypothetical protein